MGLGILSGIFIVLVVFKLLFIRILYNHPLHYFECPFHACTVEWIFSMLLLLLLVFLISLPFHLFLHLYPLHLFVLSHIGIEYHPLSGFHREVGAVRRVSLHALLPEG